MPSFACKHKKSGVDGFTLADAERHYAPDTVLEPVHIDIHLRFDDLTSRICKAKVTTTFKNNNRVATANVHDRSSIILNAIAFEDLKVLDEKVNHTYDGKQLRLEWETPFTSGEERKVTVEYLTDNPIAGLYYSAPDQTPSKAQFVISDHETERCRHWLPCVDFPIVRTTLAFTITHPATTIALANGKLIGQESQGNMKITRWHLDCLCPSYLICFAVGEFEEVDDGEVDGVPVKYYAAKGVPHADIRRSFGKTPKMIRWLTEKLKQPMPWPKYYQIALPNISGAMECISLVTWAGTVLMDERLVKEREMLIDAINIHEMGHTYFGDMTVIRHFEHAWLKESWATYIEVLYIEDHNTIEDMRFELMRNAEQYFDECKRYQRPIVTNKYDHSWKMFDQHLYPGGAWRIHMLRKLLGDDAFWAGVHKYLEARRFQTVTTEQFKHCLEDASGLNLTRFFDEWIYSPGYPQLKASYEHSTRDNTVQIAFEQTQHQPNTNVPKVFHFDLDVEVIDAEDKVYSTTVRFENERAVAVLRLGNAKPAQIRVDPEGKVLFSLEGLQPGEDILEATAKNAKDVFNRSWAYAQLIGVGSRAALKKVKTLVANEPFYGVRVKVAETLSSNKNAFGLEILGEMLLNESEPMAMASIATSCGIRDENLRQALLSFLQREELPYRAHAATLQSLAVQQNPEDLKIILDVAKDDGLIGQHGLIRAGALRALGVHRSFEAFQYLLTRKSPSLEPYSIRSYLPGAIGSSARRQEKRHQQEAIEILVDMLRDPTESVRISAVEALVELGATQALDDIEAVRATLPAQEHPWLNRRLNGLRAYSSGGWLDWSNTIIRRVEELEGKVRKLESKVQEYEAKESVKEEEKGQEKKEEEKDGKAKKD
ncbi:uncharacterized protein VTP21DRAFT_3832 [Calcarisporiella thermophila]|uniref:uncharacterized protein n=1 Tax=Calcarisporiella thermophila TaxID=911321 RepID=UPI00374249C4